MKTQLTFLRIIQVFVFTAALALGMTPVFADVGNDGVFQIDGDVVFNPTASGDDWCNLSFPGPPPFDFSGPHGCSLSSAPAATSYVTDPAPQSIFTGGGSKDQLDITQWRWKDGSVPDKDDITNSFAAVYTNGSLRLYFGADRLANNGDAQIGFWFFQNVVKLSTDGSGTFVDQAGNLATHKVGDILVLANFVNGGLNSNLAVYKVISVNSDGSVSLELLPGGSAAGTNRTCTTSGDACVATNSGSIPSLDPAYTPKSGTQGTYPPESFFEGGVNLTALGLAGECFPGFLVETRSSQSITAVLKDFTLKPLEQCGSSISTQILNSDGDDITGTTVLANTVIHDTALVKGVAGFPSPTGTVTFNRFTNDSCSGSPADTQSGVPLVDNGNSTATAIGKDFTATPGSLSYNASYIHDVNSIYPDAGPSACEPLTISKQTTTINTDIRSVNADGSIGGSITNTLINLNNAASVAVVDQITVTCQGFTPTGSVTLTRFNDGNCSGTAAGTETLSLTNGVATSAAQNIQGALSYIAVYGGDSNCQPSSDSKCEPVCAINFTTSQP